MRLFKTEHRNSVTASLPPVVAAVVSSQIEPRVTPLTYTPCTTHIITNPPFQPAAAASIRNTETIDRKVETITPEYLKIRNNRKKGRDQGMLLYVMQMGNTLLYSKKGV